MVFGMGIDPRFYTALSLVALAVWGELLAASSTNIGDTYLRLTLDRNPSSNNQLKPLKLSLVRDGLEEVSYSVVSGKPGKQELRLAKDSVSDTNEPIPEGHYRIGNLRDYGPTEHPRLAGIARYFLPLHFSRSTQTHKTQPRTDLGLHVDKDVRIDPGTAGCIGMLTRAELKQVLSWVSRNESARYLWVDYGLSKKPSKVSQVASKDSSS